MAVTWIDLLDSLNQKFDGSAQSMSAANAQDGILETYVLAAGKVAADGNITWTGDHIFNGNFDVGDPGNEAGSIQLDGISFPTVGKFNRFGTGNTAELVIHRHSTVDGSNLVFSRALSNDATHANVANNTVLGDILFTGWGDSSYWSGASIKAAVDGTPGVSDMPTRLEFWTTPPGAFIPQLRMRINSAGVVEVGTTLTVGVGTITQVTIANWNTAHGWGDHAAAGYLTDVVQDTSPILGGGLQTNDNPIVIQDDTPEEYGRILAVPSVSGAVFAHLADPLSGFLPATDAAVLVAAGKVRLLGEIAEVDALKLGATVQVYASPDGGLYGVLPPDPGWTESDTDNADYSFPTLAAWVELIGLAITIPQDVAVGGRVDAFINLYFQNGSATRGGTVDVGIGFDGVAPSVSLQNVRIDGGFDSVVPISITTTTHGGLTTGQVLSVFVRRSSEDHSQFDPQVVGTIDPSELIVSVPAEGGAGATSWGSITGTLSNQLDLQSELDAKEDWLNDPAFDGYLLSSTAVGVRSWVDPVSLWSLANAEFPDSAHFASEVVADATVSFTDSNKQSVNATTYPNLTLTAPGVGNYMLRILNSGNLVSISPGIFWDSGTPPVWAGTSILSLYFDGTNYYGSAIVGAAQ